MARKNAVLVLMSIELILNAVNINLIAFGAMHGAVAGSVFALFVIAIAAAEVGVGLAIVLLIYRNRRSVDLDDVAEMKGEPALMGWFLEHAVHHPADPGGVVLPDPVLRQEAAEEGRGDRHRCRWASASCGPRHQRPVA